MDTQAVTSLFHSAIIQILLLSSPILLISLVVGLVLSIFQATTSLQEQTLTFVPKLLAIFLTLFYFGAWMFNLLANYTRQIFQIIPELSG
ncbi:MAG: flagellar biosynthesis protein FliQ [Spirochaetia bacterium]